MTVDKLSRIEDSFYKNIFRKSSALLRDTEKRYVNGHSKLKVDIEEILLSRSAKHGLNLKQVAALLMCIRSVQSEEINELIISSARKLRKNIFDNKVSVMVPVEVTSFCASNCTFCGWKSSNVSMNRYRINTDGVISQIRYLKSIGFSHFELSGGDDINFLKNSMEKLVRLVRCELSKELDDSRISICLTPLTESLYNRLKSAGLDTVINWQETYDPSTYKKYILNGPKAYGLNDSFKVLKDGDGYLFRMKAQESAIRANLQVGMGVMIGLSTSLEADILSLLTHCHKLIRHYASEIKPIILGLPIWNAITTADTDERRVEYNQESFIDGIFELISAIYLLSLPNHKAWVFPNCRVNKLTQINSIKTAGCFTSTMVRLSPGGYLENIPEKLEMSRYYERSSVPLDKLTREEILRGEQFVHEYDEHRNYLKSFYDQGLEIVSDSYILAQSRNGDIS
jgi:2-iminoacetate synthase ThiH